MAQLLIKGTKVAEVVGDTTSLIANTLYHPSGTQIITDDGGTIGLTNVNLQNINFDNVANDAISGDKIHGGTISGSLLHTDVTFADVNSSVVNDAISGDKIHGGTISGSLLHTDVTFADVNSSIANDAISGDKIHGGTISGSQLHTDVTFVDVNSSIANDSISGDKIQGGIISGSIFVGMIASFGMSSPPTGWLVCNGGAVNRTTYASLFAAIGTTWGAGNGSSTFNLPDLRGQFLRGWANGSGNDPDRNSRTGGDAVGSSQGSQFGAHTHTPYQTSSVYDNNYNYGGGGRRYGSFGYHYATTSAGGNETRPINKYVQYCIKY